MVLTGEQITLENLYEISQDPGMKAHLDPGARAKMQKSRDYIEGRIKNGEVMYGVNTGFGAFSSVRISDSEIEQLQRNLIRSHSMGIGEPFTKIQSRAMMVLRANALARGHSGIRPAVVDKILEFLNNDLIPVIPCQGSVGASGDLAPLSHLALAIIGEGELWENDQIVPAKKLLKEKNIEPLELKAKEGLSMINGCQVMTAIGLLAAWEARRLLWLSDLAGAMTLEGMRGSRRPFDPLISATRPHPGEAKTARNLLKLMGPASEIGDSHFSEDHRVQDAYSLRCMPAVHGAAKDALRYVVKVLETEANSSTDNPLVFADDNKVLSCGNFHGMPVAHAMDFAGIAIASQASISECRISKLISPQMSELPAFLAPNGGLNSGHMIVQVAAASLVSENKILAHPASVDSIPTSAEKEDHVSMGTIAARKFEKILRNAENVVAMEFLSACQALDLLAPLKPSAAVAEAHAYIRKSVPFAREDRIFAKDVAQIRLMMQKNELTHLAESSVGPLEW
ncbi:MAG: histidine ammonia-lyase [Bdellovibrionaceae bacterium]|nr:histidine ammonia-lyase [Pseudobdellovibrionaceae bacterium]